MKKIQQIWKIWQNRVNLVFGFLQLKKKQKKPKIKTWEICILGQIFFINPNPKLTNSFFLAFVQPVKRQIFFLSHQRLPKWPNWEPDHFGVK